MLMSKSLFPERLRPGIMNFFGLTFPTIEKKYSTFMNVGSSQKAFEQIVAMAGTGVLKQKQDGGQFETDYFASGQTAQLNHQGFGLLMAISHELLMDDQYAPNLASQIGSRFALSTAKTYELYAHNVLNNGFSTVTDPMYNNPDTKALFATDHPLLKGGTFSNTLSTPTNLSELGLENLVTQMRTTTDHAGIRIDIQPQKLIVPPSLEFTAKRLLMSDMRTGTANNDINTIKTLGLELVVTPYLSSNTAWFVTTSMNNSDSGLLLLEREGMQLNSDNDAQTMNALYSIYCRFSVGYASPYGVFASQGF